jgi:hypothetical protein
MSEQDTPNNETPEQKQNSSKGNKSIKSLVVSLRVWNPEKSKTTKDATAPTRKRKRLQ